jgi:hypothetical protein
VSPVVDDQHDHHAARESIPSAMRTGDAGSERKPLSVE